MSNPNLMLSLAGISAGLGRGPSKRKLTGAAKDVHHIRKLPESLRDVARSRYDAIIARLKAQREAEMSEFYRLFPETVPFEAQKAAKVVSAFLVGQGAEATGVESDGLTLRVAGNVVAQRRSVNDRFITVCPGAFGTDKNSRLTANAALRLLGAGVRVNDIMRDGGEGYAFVAAANSGPRGGRVVFESGDSCMRVEVNKTIRQKALATMFGPEMIGPQQQFSREGAEMLPPEEGMSEERRRRRSAGRSYGPGKYMRTNKRKLAARKGAATRERNRRKKK